MQQQLFQFSIHVTLFNDRIRVYKNNLYLEDFLVDDELGNHSRINGTITNTHLKDFYMILNIEADNMHCLNTRSIHNQYFYGTIYATGNVGINGGRDGMKLAIDAKPREIRQYFYLYTMPARCRRRLYNFYS